MTSLLDEEILAGLVDNLDIDVSGIAAAEEMNVTPDAKAQAKYMVNKGLLRTKYHYEKFTGKRRPDGALNLNKLKPVHLRMISAYINGMKMCEIAEQFNVAAITVCRVLADPMAKSYIGEFDEAFKNEFKAMFPIVSDVVREGLGSANKETQLKAVDRFIKINAMITGPDTSESRETKTEQRTQARHRFIAMVRDALPAGSEVFIESEELVETVETTTSVAVGD